LPFKFNLQRYIEGDGDGGEGGGGGGGDDDDEEKDEAEVGLYKVKLKSVDPQLETAWIPTLEPIK
jgi:hypothetical protein